VRQSASLPEHCAVPETGRGLAGKRIIELLGIALPTSVLPGQNVALRPAHYRR
jgi:hypothetical protein